MADKIYYLGRNDRDYSVVFQIAGTRYEYFMAIPPQVHAIDYIARRKSNGKALAYAKRYAARTEKVTQ